MSESNYIQPELSQGIDSVLEPLFAKYHRQRCYPGLIFDQGKRKMIQINLPADELSTLLQAKHSIDNNPSSGKNRPEVKGHSDEIKEYILKRISKDKSWILGTLTANVDPENLEIIELGRGFCLVVMRRGVKLDITDGQHRKRAISELISSENSGLIGDNYFPITLVLESDFKQCQIDFRDMAQTEKLDNSLLLSFGEFEGRVGITKNLLEQVPLFLKKTEQIKGSPDSKKKLIYTINYIAKMVSCVFANDPNDELQDYDVEILSEALVNCLNLFFSECDQTKNIFDKSEDELTVGEVINFKENSLLGRSVGLEILGRLLYFVYDQDSNSFDEEKILQLARIDWSRQGAIWQGNVVLSNSTSDNSPKSKPYTITASVNAVRLAVNTAKASLGWI